MRKRGPKPKGNIKIKWSPEFAYAIGLIVTDGSLSKDERHISFTSKDAQQIENFMNCLGLTVKIGKKVSGYEGREQPNVQFGDVLFFQFLVKIGLMPAKSKIVGEIKIPKKYFFDFLRGTFDGDGSFHSYYDTRWKSSFMFYTIFISASKKHIDWLRNEIYMRLKIQGHITHGKTAKVYQLKYAKTDSFQILKNMYYSREVVCLKRKRLKVEKALTIEGKKLFV